MGPSDASDVIRRHVIERHMRTAIRSVQMDGDPRTNVPRMSEAHFIQSCQLVRGVPEHTLMMLEEWVTGSDGSTWVVDAVQIQGRLVDVPVEQLALRITLQEAARRVGMELTVYEARQLYRKALHVVQDNLVERAWRHDER